MAFGMKVTTGDFREIIKFDARAGRLFRIDRDMNNDKTQVDITSPQVRFAVDFGTLEAGWMMIGVQGPVRHMVPYHPGVEMPAKPTDKGEDGKPLFKPAFWTLVAGQSVGGVREFASSAGVVTNVMDELHQRYLGSPEAATGKIPLVSIVSTTPVTSGRGTNKSTNYAPVFEIVGWVDRLPDMGRRTVPVPAPRATGQEPARPAPQSMPAAPVMPPPAAHVSAAAPSAMPDF